MCTEHIKKLWMDVREIFGDGRLWTGTNQLDFWD